MQWKPHYTGIEIAEAKRLGIRLYLTRATNTKRVNFVRLSIPRHMVGLFKGRGNYVKGWGGWELFTGGHHIGWSTERNARWFRVQWSGSMNEPYVSVTWRVGRLGIGGHTPKWLKAIKERREQAKWEAMIGPEEQE